MSLPDRNNPYSFNQFLDWRKNVDYYADDLFIQKVVKHYTGKDWEKIDREAKAISRKASFRWKELAEASACPEKRPYMTHYDGHNNRIDRIVRPKETEIMEKEIFSEGVFSDKTSHWEKLIKMYIVYQNGEACIACPLTCTEGLVELLKKYADLPELKAILEHTGNGRKGEFAIGAQYLSEIHGGSDVPSNLLEAVKEGDTWKIYGQKFFCSATHADYAIVTAKPQGSEKVGLFVLPSWLPGNKEKEIRNGYVIDRIKWKMGTSELTTGEISFNGAVVYPAGPLEKGVANVVGIVLTYSRLTVGLSCAAYITRAVREAKKYAEFREAFGMTIGSFPMVKWQIDELDKTAKRTTAGAFKLYSEFMKLEGGLKGGFAKDEPVEVIKKRFEIRELIMLQKMATSFDCTDTIRGAMSIFGGHGVMEDFSSLPRLYRDSAINELWEGPRNVLLTQVHNDFKKTAASYKPSEFVSNVLSVANPTLIKELASELEEYVAHPNLITMDEKTVEIARKWDNYWHRFFHAYQDIAMDEIEKL